jgi:hypothetical protein
MDHRNARTTIIACLAAFSSALAFAQTPPPKPPEPPKPPTAAQIQQAVGIDAGRAEKVAALLKAEQDQRQATREQLHKLLSPEEMHRLHDLMPRPPQPPQPPGGNRGDRGDRPARPAQPGQPQ